jgi:hypothetical protein
MTIITFKEEKICIGSKLITSYFEIDGPEKYRFEGPFKNPFEVLGDQEPVVLIKYESEDGIYEYVIPVSDLDDYEDMENIKWLEISLCD